METIEKAALEKFKDLEIAIENAREQCELALDCIHQLRSADQTEVYLKSFDRLIQLMLTPPK